MIHLKVIDGEYYQVNICDSKLIGTKINDSTISEHFYGGPSTKSVIIAELKKATLINALGTDSVGLVKEVRGEVSVKLIKGVPHCELFVIP